MKSLISALNDADDRLLTQTWPKASHVSGVRMLEMSRLIDASPNWFATSGAFPFSGSVTAVSLTFASVAGGSTFAWLPQHGSECAEKHIDALSVPGVISQCRTPIVGVPLPLKS